MALNQDPLGHLTPYALWSKHSFISLSGLGLAQSDLYIHGQLSPKKRRRQSPKSPKKRRTFVTNIRTSHHFNSTDNWIEYARRNGLVKLSTVHQKAQKTVNYLSITYVHLCFFKRLKRYVVCFIIRLLIRWNPSGNQLC